MKNIVLQALVVFLSVLLALFIFKWVEQNGKNQKAELAKQDIVQELKGNFLMLKNDTDGLTKTQNLLDSLSVQSLHLDLEDPKSHTQILQSLTTIKNLVRRCQCRTGYPETKVYTATQKSGVLSFFEFALIRDLDYIYAYQSENCKARRQLLELLYEQTEKLNRNYSDALFDLNSKFSEIPFTKYYGYGVDYEYRKIFEALGSSFQALKISALVEEDDALN